MKLKNPLKRKKQSPFGIIVKFIEAHDKGKFKKEDIPDLKIYKDRISPFRRFNKDIDSLVMVIERIIGEIENEPNNKTT